MRVTSSVDSFVFWANSLTSEATIANPLPASPALAASIAAFSANKLVCSEILLITSIILEILSVSFLSCVIPSTAHVIVLDSSFMLLLVNITECSLSLTA